MKGSDINWRTTAKLTVLWSHQGLTSLLHWREVPNRGCLGPAWPFASGYPPAALRIRLTWLSFRLTTDRFVCGYMCTFIFINPTLSFRLSNHVTCSRFSLVYTNQTSYLEIPNCRVSQRSICRRSTLTTQGNYILISPMGYLTNKIVAFAVKYAAFVTYLPLKEPSIRDV